MAVWCLVPARGGSRGIPRKNVRRLAGKPLIQHVLQTLQDVTDKQHIIVSTDGDEIAAVAEPYATVRRRDASLATAAATLDEVAAALARELLEEGAAEDDVLLTIQPTSPFLRAASIQRAIAVLREKASVLSVRDDRHLRWRLEGGEPVPAYQARVNRQWLPAEFVETGGLIGCRLGALAATGTRIQTPVGLVELDDREGLDIDDHADWALAEHHANRLRILIRADAAPDMGMGHVYRAVALAMALLQHEVRLVTRGDGEYALGAAFLADAPFRTTVVDGEEGFFDALVDWDPDILVTDILDTQADWMARARHGRFAVSFEDLGPGARIADLVINDLYTGHGGHNVLEGIQYSLVAPHFDTVEPREQADPVRRVLVTFGGTDPSDLTSLALDAVAQLDADLDVTLVVGPGRPGPDPVLPASVSGRVLRSVENMALLMRDADVAITSAGRTVTELLGLGVPTVVLCQNERELTHTHASEAHGALNLGLGRDIAAPELAQRLQTLFLDTGLRRRMHERGLAATRGRSNEAVAERILAAYREACA